jgi:hypothetical protein
METDSFVPTLRLDLHSGCPELLAPKNLRLKVVTLRRLASYEEMTEERMGEHFAEYVNERYAHWAPENKKPVEEVNFKLILREWLSNAFSHGIPTNPSEDTPRLKAFWAVKRNLFYLGFQDNGAGFDLEAALARGTYPSGGLLRGRGLSEICAHDLDYIYNTYDDGRHTIVGIKRYEKCKD